MLNRLVQFFAILFCIIGLAACDSNYLSWSPDGSKMVFKGSDGLRIYESDGKLSNPLYAAYNPKQAVWLPNSRDILLLGSEDIDSWTEAKKYLSSAEQDLAIENSKYVVRQLELQGQDAFEKDEKLKAMADNSRGLAASLLYLKETNGQQMRLLIEPIKGHSKVSKIDPLAEVKMELRTVSLISGQVARDEKILWQGFDDLSGASISPDGTYALLILDNNGGSAKHTLSLVSLKAEAKPEPLAATPNKAAAWTADSRRIVFVQSLADSSDELGSLVSLAVRNADGSLIGKRDQASQLAFIGTHNSIDIHCLKDGRVLFSSVAVQLPATSKELSGIEGLYTVKPGDQVVRRIIPLTESDGSIYPISLSAGETWAALGSGDHIRVVNISTGAEEQIRLDRMITPAWKNDDELCFIKPLDKKDPTTKHDREVILHSMSTGKDRIISADWPATAVDEILIHKDKKK